MFSYVLKMDYGHLEHDILTRYPLVRHHSNIQLICALLILNWHHESLWDIHFEESEFERLWRASVQDTDPLAAIAQLGVDPHLPTVQDLCEYLPELLARRKNKGKVSYLYLTINPGYQMEVHLKCM